MTGAGVVRVAGVAGVAGVWDHVGPITDISSNEEQMATGLRMFGFMGMNSSMRWKRSLEHSRCF